MTDLTGNKDVDLLIFENLDDRSLFQYCEIGKNSEYVQKLCNDESFWLRRLQKTFGNVEKTENRKWKNLYLSLVYFTDKYENEKKEVRNSLYDNFVHELAIKNDFDVLNYFIRKGFKIWFTALLVAIRAQNPDMVKYFMSLSKIDNWISFATFAIESGNIEIAKLVIPHVDLQELLRRQSLSYLFLHLAETGKLDFLKYIFPLLKIKERDLLVLMENFSLPRDGLKIPLQQVENTFTFLANTYLSIGGKKKKLKEAIEAILYEDVKDEEYTNFLKKYKKNL